MKSLTFEMTQHLAEEVTNLATLWHAILVTGQEFFFTSHDADVVFEGNTYVAESGFLTTASANTSELSVDNVNIEGYVTPTGVTDEALRNGLWDGAYMEIFRANWMDPTMGPIRQHAGNLGQVDYSTNGYFTAELRGLLQKISQTIGHEYSSECWADLGDSECKVNLAPLSRDVTIVSAASRKNFVTTAFSPSVPAGWFTGGLAHFTSGLNQDLQMEIKSHSGTTIELFLPLPYTIAPSDGVHLSPGCNKTFDHCKNKFNNVLNMRAQPYVPGMDDILAVTIHSSVTNTTRVKSK